MKSAIYARVSTVEQNTDTQIQPLRDFSARRGWTVYAEYVDRGISGSVVQRPQLEAMMRDASARKFDAVLVWKFDRLFRSVPHMLAALDIFRGRGIEFVSLTEAMDTTTPMGKMIYTLLAAVAEFEKDLIRERTMAGMARARSEGKHIGRPQAKIDIERARVLWAGGEGYSYRRIAETLGCSTTVVFEALRADRSKT